MWRRGYGLKLPCDLSLRKGAAGSTSLRDTGRALSNQEKVCREVVAERTLFLVLVLGLGLVLAVIVF